PSPVSTRERSSAFHPCPTRLSGMHSRRRAMPCPAGSRVLSRHWLYIRFTLSFRDVEDLLAERGIMVSYETVRRWVSHFGPMIAADLRKRRPKPYTTWHLDEVYLKISGRMVYLWRAVAKISLRSRCRLQHLQRPPPPHFRSNASHFPRRGDEHVAHG